VPLHIRNAPTKLMKELDYGKDYKYAHDYTDAYVPQEYLPEEIKGQTFYNPEGRVRKDNQRADKYWRQRKSKAEDE